MTDDPIDIDGERENMIKPLVRPARNLVSGAIGADPDRVTVDIDIEGGNASVVVTDDGRGMTSKQFERFFSGLGDDPFGASAIHVRSTRDGTTVEAHTTDPPEYHSERLEAESREEGTRVEIEAFDVPEGVGEKINAPELKERFTTDEDTFSLAVTIDDASAE